MDLGMTTSAPANAGPSDDDASAASGGPVGSGNYAVQAGECVYSIAFDHGFFWETLWNHPNNAALKRARGNPNVLLEGDQLFIPDLRVKQAAGGTASRHTFKVKGVPAKFRLVVTADVPPPPPPAPAPPSLTLTSSTADPDPAPPPTLKPRANVPYVLKIDDVLTNGQTDGNGLVECVIPPNAKRGQLTLDPGTLDERVIALNLGGLDPVTELSGVKQRLANLGYDCGDVSADPTDALSAAVMAFQSDAGLTTTGDADDATRQKLKALHGS